MQSTHSNQSLEKRKHSHAKRLSCPEMETKKGAIEPLNGLKNLTNHILRQTLQ